MSERSDRRRGRLLSKEDRELWRHVTKSVAPMRKGQAAEDAEHAVFQAALERIDQQHDQPQRSKLQTNKPPTTIERPPAATRPPQKPAHGHAALHNRRVAPTSPGRQPAPTVNPSPGLTTQITRRIAKGRDPIEGYLDLHGMRQETALGALRSFLAAAHKNEKRTVLVITGKGRPSGDDQDRPWTEPTPDRGVLRRQLPLWLGRPEFRAIVTGCEPASVRHGGDGAFYIRLRARRRT
ncbi:MAG: Smr/MutS family protein [Pseudomonadota bacterium]